MWLKIGYTAGLFLLIGVVEHFVGWANIVKPWTEASPTALACGAVLVLGSYVIRAARVYRFFPGCGDFIPCVRLFLMHNVFINFLPMHSGEVSFPILMKRYFATSVNRSVPRLLCMRLLDLHTLLLIGLIALWLAGPWEWVMWLIPIWAIAPAVGIYLWRGLDIRQGAEDNTIISRIKQSLSTVPQSISALVECWAWTVLNWFVKIATFAWILTIFSSINFIDSLFGATGGELSNLLPFKIPAGVGTYEAGIVTAVTSLGEGMHSAIGGAVNLHFFIAGMALLGAMFALLIPRPRVVPGRRDPIEVAA